jgi:hypothetical protein
MWCGGLVLGIRRLGVEREGSSIENEKGNEWYLIRKKDDQV